MTTLPLIASGEHLAVALRVSVDGPALTREPVLPSDLSDVYSEAWREQCLRRGHPHLPLADVRMRVRPSLSKQGNQRCAGFEVETELPNEPIRCHAFTISSLRHVADRAAAPFIKAEVLKPGESFFYEVVPQAAQLPAQQPNVSTVVSFKVRTAPLRYLQVSLPDLVAQSTSVDVEKEDTSFPVFITRDALQKAEKAARKGGEQVNPVETGGVLIGSLALCQNTGEFCVIIRDVLGVQDADETRFSLSYTSRSWQKILAVVKARQDAHPDDPVVLAGQVHGHPFSPGVSTLCAECSKLPICSANSAFASEDDQTWHRAVFAQQPWALCHIFGLSARGDWVNRLFGLHDGRLRARGYYILPDFKPTS